MATISGDVQYSRNGTFTNPCAKRRSNKQGLLYSSVSHIFTKDTSRLSKPLKKHQDHHKYHNSNPLVVLLVGCFHDNLLFLMIHLGIHLAIHIHIASTKRLDITLSMRWRRNATTQLSQRPTHCTRQLDMGDFGFSTENVLASGAIPEDPWCWNIYLHWSLK